MSPGVLGKLGAIMVTYLAPIVLGKVAKLFSGRPDAASVSRLFSEQACNICGDLPEGLSLGDFGAVSGRSSALARHGHPHEPQSTGGLPEWLLEKLAPLLTSLKDQADKLPI